MEEDDEVNKTVGEEGEWRITTTTGGGDHHHAHIVTVMSAEELDGGGGTTTTATFVPVAFDTGGRGGTGEVRLIQVPISMLPPNFHFLHSTQSPQDDSNTQQILTQGGSQDDQLAVTLVTTAQSEVSERDMNSSVVHEEHNEEDFCEESVASLAPPAIPQPSLPTLRSRRSRPIRKHADVSRITLKKEDEKAVTSGEESGAGKSVGPTWPEQKCANCAVEFNVCEASEDEQLVEKSSHLKTQGMEGEQEVPNHEALQYVFNIRIRSSKGKDVSPPESLCWLCTACSCVLEELYMACKAFTKLTKEEAFLYKRLRSKVVQIQKSKDLLNPLSNTAEDMGSKVEVKLETIDYAGEDEADDDEEWITGDLSDDEDFRASPTDLEKAEVSSESSGSETNDQYHTYSGSKRKSKTNDLMASGSPKKKKGRKNKTGDSFWWDSNTKTDSDDDVSNLGYYKRSKKLRVKKSLLTGISYDCNACDAGAGASFQSPRELKIHLRECHREVGVVTDIDTLEGSAIAEGMESEPTASAISCRLCSFQLFPSVNEFKDHWAKEHREANFSSSEVLPYECFTCKRTFTEWTALIKHRFTHNLERPYKCRLCGESWRRADELQVHWSRTHAKDFLNDNATSNAGSDGSTSKKDDTLPPAKRREAVPCSVCGKAFIRHDHLKLHMRIHTGEKPFPCPTCGKAFSDPRGLAYHEVTHSSERPYCCTVCGMTFKRLHHLNDHERNHASDVARPFSCELCGKAFKYKKHLNSHSVIHGNSKDHSCEICHKAFNRKDNLRQHVKKVHGKEPGPETMSSGGGGLVHHSLVSSLEGGGEDEDVLVGDEPEVSINEEGTVRSGHVEVPTATAIPIVTGSGGEGLAVDHIVYMTL